MFHDVHKGVQSIGARVGERALEQENNSKQHWTKVKRKGDRLWDASPELHSTLLIWWRRARSQPQMRKTMKVCHVGRVARNAA